MEQSHFYILTFFQFIIDPSQKKSTRISLKAHIRSAKLRQANWVIKTRHFRMLYRKIITVFSDILIRHLNALCGQKVEFQIIQPGDVNCNDSYLKVYNIRFHYVIHKTSPRNGFLNQINPVNTFIPYLYSTKFSTVLPHYSAKFKLKAYINF